MPMKAENMEVYNDEEHNCIADYTHHDENVDKICFSRESDPDSESDSDYESESDSDEEGLRIVTTRGKSKLGL